MKKVALLMLVVLGAMSLAMAQLQYLGPSNDVLGAHNGYGRGCVMCHAPHSGAAGNGVNTTDTASGNVALWGQDLTPLYGKSLGFGDAGSFAVTLPAAGTITSAHDANAVIIFCLSCHDGVAAKPGMMQGTTVETLPIVGGHAPTFLGTGATSTAENYANDHPVGGNAIVTCGGQYNWDCTGGNTVPISMNGTASSQFLTNNPSSFWNGGSGKLATFGTAVTAVTCTTCHDQHSMAVYAQWNSSTSTYSYYPTMFFVKGKYTPNQNGNAVAQFCRNCHGGESNEMHGLSDVPTI